MSDETDETFLGRWSRRKAAARSGEAPAPAPSVAQAQPVVHPDAAPAAGSPAPLPSVESLTPESDFAAFMNPDVDPAMRGQALKTLFGDARYNLMDGLDVYIDDYTKPDPLPEGWLEKLNQFAALDGISEPVPGAEEAPAQPQVAANRSRVDADVAQERPPGDGSSNALPPQSEVPPADPS